MEADAARIRREVEAERRVTSPLRLKDEPITTRVSMATPTGLRPPNTHSVRSGYVTPSKSLKPKTAKLRRGSVDSVLHLQGELFKLQSNIRRAHKEKERTATEVKMLQDNIRRNHQEVKSTEQQLKDVRSQAEDARTDLMLKEFKRDSARKELEQLQQQMTEKRQTLQDLKVKEEQSHEVLKQARDFGVTKEELARIIMEREELRGRLAGLEAAQSQRQAAEAQLAAGKEELTRELRKANDTIDSLQQEASSRSKLLEEAQSKLDSTQKKLDKLEAKHAQMDKDKSQLIKEKINEYEELKKRSEEQLSVLRHASSTEARELREQLADVTARLNQLQSDVSKAQGECTRLQQEVKGKDEHNMTLREEVLHLKHQLIVAADKRDSLVDLHQKALDTSRQEKEREVEQVRKALVEQKDAEMEQVRLELEADADQRIAQMERFMQHQISERQQELVTKDIEIDILQEKLRQLEATSKHSLDKSRQDAEDRMSSLLRAEKKKWEAEWNNEHVTKMAVVQREYEQTIGELQNELGKERDRVMLQLKQISNLTKELDGTKQEAAATLREKTLTLERSMLTSAKEQKDELDKIKDDLAKEASQSLELLRQTCRQQEEDLGRLRVELTTGHQRQQRQASLSEQQEHLMLAELNEECKRVAAILGVTPRVVVPGLHGSLQNGLSPSVASGRVTGSKSLLTMALTNLKESNDELVQHVSSLQHEVNAVRDATTRLTKDKKDEVETVRRQMQEEKQQALENLKNRLVKEHVDEMEKQQRMLGKGRVMSRALQEKDGELREIQQNMAAWKEHTADRLASKFQLELANELDKKNKEFKKEKREWEREKTALKRDIEKLERDLQRLSQKQHLQQQPQLVYATPLKTPPTLTSSMMDTPPVHYNTIISSQVGPSTTPPQATSSRPPVTTVTHAPYGTIQAGPASLDNTLRRSQLYASVPDLSLITHPVKEVPRVTGDMRQIEKRLEQLEDRTRQTDQQAKRTEDLLQHKIAELSRLHTARNFQPSKQPSPVFQRKSIK